VQATQQGLVGRVEQVTQQGVRLLNKAFKLRRLVPPLLELHTPTTKLSLLHASTTKVEFIDTGVFNPLLHTTASHSLKKTMDWLKTPDSSR
jgi:hypothetical protein